MDKFKLTVILSVMIVAIAALSIPAYLVYKNCNLPIIIATYIFYLVLLLGMACSMIECNFEKLSKRTKNLCSVLGGLLFLGFCGSLTWALMEGFLYTINQSN